jgi:hypothetical protein
MGFAGAADFISAFCKRPTHTPAIFHRVENLQARWAGLVLKIRCHTCSLSYPAGDLTFLPGGIVRCDKCLEKTMDEMQKFMASHSMACYECHANFGPGDIRVSIVWKDGIWQALCERCSQAYVPKRRDLFKGTPFAKEMNLV